MSDPKQGEQPTQKTPTGHEIPVPTHGEVEEFFKGVTGKRPVREQERKAGERKPSDEH